jgi:heptose I phosphotransferase
VTPETVPATDPRDWRWPDDYILLDDGRLWVRPDLVEPFRKLGWTNAVEILSDERRQVWRRLPSRQNATVRLELSDGRTVYGHLKCHARGTFWVWLRELLAGGAGLPPGLAEAAAVGCCQAAGVATMQVLAAGATAARLPWQRQSFFLSEHLADSQPADDFWQSNVANPARFDGGRRQAFLDALANAARRFHEAGLYHRDFYWCHFLVREPAAGRFVVHLIDLQRVGRPQWLKLRWWLKDLAQLWFSTPGDVTEAEKRRLYQRYCDAASLRWPERLFYRLIRLRAALYAWKERRR